MRPVKTIQRIILIAIAVCLLSCPIAQAKKGGNRGGDEPLYTLLDLLGLTPGWSIQSAGQFITNRDNASETLIAGNSHWYFEPDTVPPLLPVLWRIDDQGEMYPNNPVNLGLPPSPREIEVTGMNSAGVIVSITRIAGEKDEDDNWIFPSYVDVPEMPYQEIPIPTGASRSDTWLAGVNDSGQIVGWYAAPDPNDLESKISYAALWQVLPDKTISDPVNLDDSTDGHLIRIADINNAGVMCGNLDGWPTIAWLEGSVLKTSKLDWDPLFFGADATTLNDAPLGDEKLTIVGKMWRDDIDERTRMRAYAWRPFDAVNPTTVLGTFGGYHSEATDVNLAGQVVGWADTRKHGPQAFLYSDGQMTNLNSVVDVGQIELEYANAINDDGDITGFMRIPRPVSQSHGFLLRPIEQ